MTNTPKKNRDVWDNRELGASEDHVRKASPAREKKLDESLSLKAISIRLQKSLIANLKNLAEEDGIAYQAYIRQILTRYVRQIHDEKRERLKHDKHKHSFTTR